MGCNCAECRKCEENMYWSRFQTVQFCQFLSGKFKEYLAIPKKFTNNMRDKMGTTVALRGPSGNVWNVGIGKKGDMLFFKHGWQEFVEDHSLQENDILIFKYDGNSRFDVLMFDRGSLCERESSYFVKKCEHAVVGQGSKRRRSLQENPQDTAESSDGAADFQLVERIEDGSARQEASRTQHTQSTPTPSGRKKTKKGKQGSGEVNVLQLKSRRRTVTEDEIKKAHDKAKEAASGSTNHFIVVMRPSHVYKGFFMVKLGLFASTTLESIPADYAKANFPGKDQPAVLRIKDQKWPVRYHFKGYGGGLSVGWKNFVMDNFLEEYDVCLFEHKDGSEDPFTLDVKIFRVVEEVIPPFWTQAGETSREGTTRGEGTSRGANSLRGSTGEDEDNDDDADDYYAHDVEENA